MLEKRRLRGCARFSSIYSDILPHLFPNCKSFFKNIFCFVRLCWFCRFLKQTLRGMRAKRSICQKKTFFSPKFPFFCKKLQIKIKNSEKRLDKRERPWYNSKLHYNRLIMGFFRKGVKIVRQQFAQKHFPQSPFFGKVNLNL